MAENKNKSMAENKNKSKVSNKPKAGDAKSSKPAKPKVDKRIKAADSNTHPVEAEHIKTKNEILLEKNAQNLNQAVNEESKRKKRKKRLILLLLLLLLLLVIVASSLLAYFLFARSKTPENKLVLGIDINTNLIMNDDGSSELVDARRFTFEEGKEQDNRTFGFTAELKRNSFLKMDYFITNTSGVDYSYILTFNMELDNIYLKYYINGDEQNLTDITESKNFRFASNENIYVTIQIGVIDPGLNANCDGSILFSVIV